jgi:hypothetical protein
MTFPIVTVEERAHCNCLSVIERAIESGELFLAKLRSAA